MPAIYGISFYIYDTIECILVGNKIIFYLNRLMIIPGKFYFDMNSHPVILHILVMLCLPLQIYSQHKDLIYEDKVYNPDIKTVQLYADNGHPAAKLEPAVINLRKPLPLILEFDELYNDARYFQARIVHCNWDWTPSALRSIEYLDEYNEFEITNYEYSVNSKVPYTHYIFRLPQVNQPGNYVLVIFDRDDPDQLILSKRYIVYDQLVKISPLVEPSSSVGLRRSHQQINFTVNYNGVEVYNPSTDIKVIIRKNQSWVTAIYDLKPTSVKEFQKIIEYRHFNMENNFYGGNEYRFFDLSSVDAPGRNVDRIRSDDDRIDAFLFQDKRRDVEFYGDWQDYNGGYIISSIEGNDPVIEAEYVNVHFFLLSEQPLNSEVYVYGMLSQYNLLPSFKMQYESEFGGYRADLLLKQGWYDYIYYTPANPYALEGSYYETRNEFEILLYYRPQGKISEYLIGYTKFNSR